MIEQRILNTIQENLNTGIEYEIALYYKLLTDQEEKQQLRNAINKRNDSSKINSIIEKYDVSIIEDELQSREFTLENVSLETQNDNIGPADILLQLHSSKENTLFSLGISVKYNNSCNLNVTGREFLNEKQIEDLRQKLEKIYVPQFIQEMNSKHGNVQKWFRKRKKSETTCQFIDLIRTEIINNWPHVNKSQVLSKLYQSNSPIDFWTVTYKRNKTIELKTHHDLINLEQADKIELSKHRTSYVDFKLNGKIIGRMQVKFNNGFLEKGTTEDLCIDGILMRIGQPFTSWNFNLI